MPGRAHVYIGVGGMGVETVGRIEKLTPQDENTNIFAAIDFPGTDEMNTLSDRVIKIGHLGVDDTLGKINRRYRDNREFKRWWLDPGDKPYVPPKIITEKSRGMQVRLNGRYALYENFDQFMKVYEQIQNRINDITTGAETTEVYYYVCTSLGGGTGSGAFIDIISYLRFRLEEGRDKVFGIFYDATVMDELISEDAPRMAMGALVELNHWMVHPRDYKMNYSHLQGKVKGKVEINLAEKDNIQWLDAVYLIQHKTKTNKYFTAHDSTPARDHYIDLVAFTFSSQKVLAKIDENIGARLGNLLPIDGKATNFIGLGYSQIKTPVSDISQFLKSKLLLDDDIFDQGSVDQQFPKTFLENGVEFEGQSVSLLEVKAKGITGILSKTTAYSQINKMRSSKPNSILKANSKHALTNILHLDENLFHSFAGEGAELLSKVESSFSVSLDSVVKKSLPLLEFQSITDWLTQLYVGIQREQRKLSNFLAHDKKSPQEQLNEMYEHLLNRVNTIKKETNIFGNPSGLLKTTRNELHGGVKKYIDNKIQLSINTITIPFYTRLLEIIDDRRNRIEEFKEAYFNILEQYKILFNEVSDQKDFSQAKFNSRPILDEERLKKDEYALTLDVGVSANFTEKIEKKVKENLEYLRNSVANLLKRGNKDIDLNSIHKIYDNASVSSEDVEFYLNEVLRTAIEPELDQIIRDAIPFAKAYNEYLRQVYKEIEDARGKDLYTKRVKNKYEADFGDATNYHLLFEEENLKDFDSWKSVASRILLKRFLSLVEPFWNPDQSDYDEFFEKNMMHFLKTKYVSKPKDFAISEDDFQDDINIIELSDVKDRLTFLKVDIGCPLYAFKNLSYIYDIYYEKERSSKRGGTLPAHTDRRFWYEWSPEENYFSRPTNTNVLLQLYLLGLGLSILHKKNKKFYFDNTRVESTWNKFIKVLKDDDELQSRLASRVLDKSREQYYTNDKTLIDTFIKGYKRHLDFKMGGKAFREFQEFTEDLGIDYSTDQVTGEIHILHYGVIPQSEREIEDMFNHFKQI